MKAFIWRTGIKISPFQDPIADSLILNRPLRDHQRETLTSLGLDVAEVDDPGSIKDDEYLLVKDNLYFTRTALERFMKKALSGRTPGACALEKGPFTEFTKFIQDLRIEKDPATGKDAVIFGLCYINGKSLDATAIEGLPPVVIEAEQKAFPIEQGTFMPSSVEVQFTPAYTDAALMHVCHWTHLWLLNLMTLGNTLLTTFVGSKLRVALRALSAFSLNKHKIANRFVVKGKHCDIHPTAVVQGSILGNHVQIGPYCVVQGCILGDHVKVSEQSIIMGSVFGERVSTCPRGWVKLCVVYPRSSTGRMHACLIGRNVFMASLAYFFDVKLKGTIKVFHNGRHVDTGMNFLGGCVGHEAVIGPDTWLASGREIPNGAMIMKNPNEIISIVPPDLPPKQPLTVRNGVLSRVEDPSSRREEVRSQEELPGYSKDRE